MALIGVQGISAGHLLDSVPESVKVKALDKSWLTLLISSFTVECSPEVICYLLNFIPTALQTGCPWWEQKLAFC